MIVTAVLTLLLLLLWVLGFGFAGAWVGNLIHLLLLLAFVTGFAFIIGALLLLISVIQKKNRKNEH